tara:strand:- start:165 stop:614 length:450 start_codon:yes stop_codon:yes gene_type:complete
MNFTPATAADLADVSSWVRTHADCQSWAGPAVSFPIVLSRLSAEIMFCQDNSFSVNTADGLAGFGQLIQLTDERYHLARIITNPAYRGQGIARYLCTQLINTGWQRGASVLSLNVYRNNAKAQRLYQQLGFCEQADRSDANIIYMLNVR